MVRLEQVRGELIERLERIDRRFAQYEQRLVRIDQRTMELGERLEQIRRELERRDEPTCVPVAETGSSEGPF